MKKIVCTLFTAVSLMTFAQQESTLQELKRNFGAEISLNQNTSVPNFIRFTSKPLHLNAADSKAKAEKFIADNYKIFKLSSPQDLIFLQEFTDNYGLKNVVFAQKHKDIAVYDGVLKFHFNSNGDLNSVNGNIIPDIADSGIAEISKSKAADLAKQIVKEQNLAFNKTLPLENNEPTLFIFPKGLAQDKEIETFLAYEVEVTNKNDVREFVFIDAHTGKLVEQFTGIHNIIDRKLYETNTNATNLKWSEGNAFPGILTIWQQNEVVTSEHVYNFFKNAFNYISYDNADHAMITINNNPNINCPNANWNGTTANYCNGTAADDVVAHEWGHAYTSYTSKLLYQYQSGALNESYSDVWGETIDLLNNYQDTGENLAVRTTTACTGTQRWKIGEDATAFGAPIRDMWNPNCNGDPANMLDANYHCASTDSGGVHINSGVGNRLYSLLVDGGTYGGYTITPIGFVKAAHLWWRAQNVYLTATSGYETFANALEASFADLVGTNLQGLSTTTTPAGLSGQSFSAGELQNLQNALLAVKLRSSPNNQCGFTPLLAATPALCNVATAAPLLQENWENGLGNWTVSNVGATATWTARNWVIDTTLPKGRTGKAIFGTDPSLGNCSSNFQNGIIRLESPLITFPAYSAGGYEMAFNHLVATEEDYDGGNIKYSLNGGAWTIVPSTAFTANPYNLTLAITGNDNPIKGQEAFSGADEGGLEGSWGQSIINLTALGVTPSSNIKFRFEMGTDGCGGLDGWYIDEIYVYNCSNVLGTQETEKMTGLSVYPNPTSGIVTISNGKNIDLKNAEVYNVTGQLVSSITLGRSGSNKIDLTQLVKGNYILKVNSKDKTQSFKIIKK
ncbi:bacillolysin [Chryseobacterium sp. Leaf180]|uniref:M4 family metallopeptidase n=1 Tax=Chryseobacterium sp. Leaf180 TaxID=1736289 RepID=UPI0006FFC90E|nr:M4 family metallopeptidase [Chryseobacterium sp. Leaf180]KQR94674.1 bacillolysin [Chryseobacterium sp. Leaf180]